MGGEEDQPTGALEDQDDAMPSLEGFDVAVRDTAYFLWEQDGRPEGRADEYWYRALEQHFRERAYDIWLKCGRPEGREKEIWEAAQKDGTPDKSA